MLDSRNLDSLPTVRRDCRSFATPGTLCRPVSQRSRCPQTSHDLDRERLVVVLYETTLDFTLKKQKVAVRNKRKDAGPR
jgi:hypothetical protein